MNTQWLSPSQVAETLGVTVETLRRWRRAGTGPQAHRMGSRLIRYRHSDVVAWLSEEVA